MGRGRGDAPIERGNRGEGGGPSAGFGSAMGTCFGRETPAPPRSRSWIESWEVSFLWRDLAVRVLEQFHLESIRSEGPGLLGNLAEQWFWLHWYGVRDAEPRALLALQWC